MRDQADVAAFARAIPKAELHLHVEGALEPWLLKALLQDRESNEEDEYRILEPPSSDDAAAFYDFKDLADFIEEYRKNCLQLCRANDYFNLSYQYLRRVATTANVKHAELSFDPGNHLDKKVGFNVFFEGLWEGACRAEREFGTTFCFIMAFRRDKPLEEAQRIIKEALPFKSRIAGVGLASTEVGHPCHLFKGVMDQCRELGWELFVAHAGEEGPASNVREAIELLKVNRVDHGVKVLDDESVVKLAINSNTCFTVCPVSNVVLKVASSLNAHPLRKMLAAGLTVTINSDDPAYFGGYLDHVFTEVCEHIKLTRQEVMQCARNSVMHSFASESRKIELLKEIEKFDLEWQQPRASPLFS